MKAKRATDVGKFTDIPNIGPRMAEDFKQLGLKDPHDLKGKDAYALYQKMNRISGVRQDPCVLDTYMAAVDFMGGAPVKPWWSYTTKRKKEYPNI
jgi:hypothetical protein